jgi:DNA (cytosine-5)-methyltransferase 1
MTAFDLQREREHRFGDEWGQLDSGLYVPGETFEVSYERALPTGVDLFCGAGGFSLGFHQAGFHVVAASDNELDCMATYLVNLGGPETLIHFMEDAPTRGKRKGSWHEGDVRAAGEIFEAAGTGWIASSRDHDPGSCRDDLDPQGALDFCQTYHAPPAHRLPCEHFYFGDVTLLSGHDVVRDLGVERGDVGAVFGGPPCQGFSMANVNAGPDDPRNELVFVFARIVLEINPKSMVMENVPRLLTMQTPQGVPVVDALCRLLADGGFSTYDALRKSLVGDNRGALRRDRASSDESVDDDEIDDSDAQLDLFDV